MSCERCAFIRLFNSNIWKLSIFVSLFVQFSLNFVNTKMLRPSTLIDIITYVYFYERLERIFRSWAGLKRTAAFIKVWLEEIAPRKNIYLLKKQYEGLPLKKFFFEKTIDVCPILFLLKGAQKSWRKIQFVSSTFQKRPILISALSQISSGLSKAFSPLHGRKLYLN